ncbi:GAF domain-containing SpoIIE family protein phosphatase [Spirillospora sp. NPDC049652]
MTRGKARRPAGEVRLTMTLGLLRLIAQQRERLGRLQRELEQITRGTLELHAEMAEAAEQLQHAAQVQAHLLEAERKARATAESTRARLAFLAHAGATLSASLDHEQILGRLHSLITAQRVAVLDIWLADAQRSLVPFGQTSGDVPDEARRAFTAGLVHHATPHPALRATGLVTVPAEREVLAIPLVSRERTLGAVAYTPAGQPFTAEDVAVYEELTRLSAVAIDNAMRYEYEHGVAQRLQRAMLTELPPAGRLEFAARYLPAEAGLNVGGDWYDAFEQPDGQVAAAIGDVTGHGLRAATFMGQLRTALRAYAIDGATPGEALSRLHRLVVHLQPQDMATSLLFQAAPDGRLRWANAGHLPPMLRGAAGDVRVLTGSDPLLGAPIDEVRYRTRTVDLPPGGTVLLYTDGLIERREGSLEAAVQRLAAVFAEATGDLEDVAEQILAEMLADSAREDDTCLLLCRAAPVSSVPEPCAPRPLRLPHR